MADLRGFAKPGSGKKFLQAIVDDAKILPVTSKPGTANIPPETTPKAVGGNPFKDSIIQEPVYRGDTTEFSEFDKSKITNADFRAFFFTKDKTYAPIFANYKPKGVAESTLSPTVRQAHISLKNPLDLRDKLSNHPELSSIDKDGYKAYAERHSVGDFLESVIQERTATIERKPFIDAESLLDGSEEGARKYREAYSRAIRDRKFKTPEEYENAKDSIGYLRDFRKEASFGITDKIEALGYDGLIRPETFTAFGGPNAKGDVSYAVFNPDQIKVIPNPSRPPEAGGQSILNALENPSALKTIVPMLGTAAALYPQTTQAGQGQSLPETIAKMGTSAPAGAVLSSWRNPQAAATQSLQEPLFDPTTLMAGPTKYGGGLLNMLTDMFMKAAMGGSQ